jgi:hypothetical protein
MLTFFTDTVIVAGTLLIAVCFGASALPWIVLNAITCTQAELMNCARS